jgi:photosystem II stability/assembly factor-like uncharacterized protein
MVHSRLRTRGLVAAGLASLTVNLCLLLTGPGSAFAVGRWTAQKVPAEITALNQISCPSAARCFAAAETNSRLAVIATTDAGKVWSTHLLPRGPSGASDTAIACASSTVCFVAGGVGGTNGRHSGDTGVAWKTANAGHSWTVLHLPVRTPALLSISCPTSATCYATGNARGPAPNYFTSPVVIVTRNGGGSWRKASPAFKASTEAFLSAISCPDTKSCWTLGETTISDGGAAAVLASTNGGENWITTPLARPFPTLDEIIYNIACPTTAVCIASGGIDGKIDVTTDRGQHWTLRHVPNVYVESLSCPSASTCWATGVPWNWENSLDLPHHRPTRYVAAEGTKAGTAWTVATLPGAPQPMPGTVSLSCQNKKACWAVTRNPVAIYALAHRPGQWSERSCARGLREASRGRLFHRTGASASHSVRGPVRQAS